MTDVGLSFIEKNVLLLHHVEKHWVKTDDEKSVGH